MARRMRRARPAQHAPARRALQPGRAALGLPDVRAPDHRARKHPDRELSRCSAANARRARRRSRRAIPSSKRSPARCPATSPGASASRTAMLGALLFAWAMIALAFIDLDTFYLPDSITLPLLWAGLLFNIGGTFHRPALGRDRRGGRLSRAVDRVLGIQARHRQGRHGLRRLQAARRDRRLARLEDAAADDPALLAGRRRRSASA